MRCTLVESSALNVMNEIMVKYTFDGSAKRMIMAKRTLKRVNMKIIIMVLGGTIKTKNSMLAHDGCTNKGLE